MSRAEYMKAWRKKNRKAYNKREKERKRKDYADPKKRAIIKERSREWYNKNK